MSPVSGALDALRQPEYVGENRCMPCTIVNVLIAVVLATLAWHLLAPIASVVVLVVSLAAIGLRGYLVPGTPALTTRYLPDRVLALFEKAPATQSATTPADEAAADSPGGGATDLDVEAVLVESGILAPCRDRDDLCLVDEFRSAWRDAMTQVSDEDATAAAVAALLDVDEHSLELTDRGQGAFVATYDGRHAGQWESHAALVADAAAADLVAARDPDWEHRAIEARGELLGGLRLFLDRCPDCGGDVTFGRETVESCCRSRSVAAVSCESCDARLFEADIAD